MNDLRKAAEMAIKTLLDPKSRADQVADAVKALRQALATEEALDRMVAENQRLGLYGEDLQPAIEKGTKAWADVPGATEWVEELRGNDTPEVTPEVPCKTHPDAPHGFNRNASFDEDRYVCDCEFWEPDVDAVNISEERVHKSDKSIHEPVGYVSESGRGAYILLGVDLEDDTPLYAAPYTKLDTSDRVLHKEWVGLTKEEMFELFEKYSDRPFSLMLATHDKIKEKNT